MKPNSENILDTSKFKIDDFNNVEFWDNTIKNLHTLLPSDLRSGLKTFDLDDNSIEFCKNLLVTEGFIKMPQLQWDNWFSDISDGIKHLKKLNIPVPFIFAYCEPWLLASKLNVIIKKLLGEEYILLPDLWAWYVDPKNGDAGWGPHRDKGPHSLFENGKPKSLTLWIPLTDATTDNSCMYILPANRDPSYLLGGFNREKIDMQNIVALPVNAGSPLIWNQAVLHWGSRSLPRNITPRISLAFEVQIAKMEPYNKPVINPTYIPKFEERIKLICKQILQYAHMYPLQPDLESYAKKKLNLTY